MIGINAGSGQRPFDNTKGWINLDVQPRSYTGTMPDIIGDMRDLSRWADGTVDCVVSHHTLEHFGCGEGDPFVAEAFRVLRSGGSLLVFVPNMRALAQRWLTGEIDDYIYNVNVYGAYLGNEADRHKWGYRAASLKEYLEKWQWSQVLPFDWRAIEGADIAKDWWILGLEAVK